MASARAKTRGRHAQQAPAPETPAEDRTMDLVKKVGAVVGVVSGIAGLVFLFLPQLKPEAPAKPSAPHDLTIKLGHVAVTAPRTRGEFLDDADRTKRGFTHAQLKERGAMAVFPVSITGYRGKHLTLQRQLYDLTTGKVGRAREFGILPQADVYHDHPWQDWVPLARFDQTYVLVFKIFAEHDPVATSCTESDPFGAPRAEKPPTICPPTS